MLPDKYIVWDYSDELCEKGEGGDETGRRRTKEKSVVSRTQKQKHNLKQLFMLYEVMCVYIDKLRFCL